MSTETLMTPPEAPGFDKATELRINQLCENLFEKIRNDPDRYCHGDSPLLENVPEWTPAGREAEMFGIAEGIRDQYQALECDKCRSDGGDF